MIKLNRTVFIWIVFWQLVIILCSAFFCCEFCMEPILDAVRGSRVRECKDALAASRKCQKKGKIVTCLIGVFCKRQGKKREA